MQPIPGSDRLRSAPWLNRPGIHRVFAALAATGGTSRAVGGAVRNTLLGDAIDDVDIATSASPEAVIAAAERAGLHAVPTGLKHGTVTLVAAGLTYEVTTLRKDVATDGRHATVSFTDDWAEDAKRRDFTINALYCDPDGTLFDPLGGAADLAPVHVRFIGDARARIREDYLRILRFFRFSARYAAGAFDAAGLAACGDERAGLAQISAERIRAELLKLLITPRAAETCKIMQAHGFLVGLLGAAPSQLRLARLTEIDQIPGNVPDPILRLACLALTPQGDAGALARRLRLSGDERGRLKAIAAGMTEFRVRPDDILAKKMIYRQGARGFRDLALAAWAASPAPPADRHWQHTLGLAGTWTPPLFPLTGQVVMARGVPGGPAIGRLLTELERWWISQNFAPTREDCLQELVRRLTPL